MSERKVYAIEVRESEAPALEPGWYWFAGDADDWDWRWVAPGFSYANPPAGVKLFGTFASEKAAIAAGEAANA